MIHLRGGDLRLTTLLLSGEYQTLRHRLGILLWLTLQGVAQLVARTAGGREVAGSSPVTQTIEEIA